MAHSEDDIRDKVLQYFYQIHTDGSGTYNGRERGDVAVREISMQSQFDRAEVSRSIEYLVKNNLLNHVVEHESSPDDVNIKVTKHSYQISEQGIAQLGSGKFKES